MKNNKQIERWSPWLLLVAVIVLWQIICSGFGVSEFIFPSPWRIWTQFWEFKEIIAGHAWRTFWVTMAGFGLAIVVGVLLGFVIGSSRLAYAAMYPLMTAFNALPKAAFGDFIARVPAPLSIGTVELSDGTRPTGFLCEPAGVIGAEDVTSIGDWRQVVAEVVG